MKPKTLPPDISTPDQITHDHVSWVYARIAYQDEPISAEQLGTLLARTIKAPARNAILDILIRFGRIERITQIPHGSQRNRPKTYYQVVSRGTMANYRPQPTGQTAQFDGYTLEDYL